MRTEKYELTLTGYKDEVVKDAKEAMQLLERLGAVKVELVHKMHPVWAAFWYTYILAFVALNLAAAALEPWTWYVVYAAFLPPELVGAAIKTKFKGKIVGDTLSESLWTFAQKGLARKMFVGMFGIVLLARLWTLFDITAVYAGFVDYHWTLRLPWDTLILGAGLWLPLHLFDLGKHG